MTTTKLGGIGPFTTMALVTLAGAHRFTKGTRYPNARREIRRLIASPRFLGYTPEWGTG